MSTAPFYSVSFPRDARDDLLDLGTLQRGPTGRQRDAGVQWPEDFELVGVVPVPIVRDRKGKLWLLDPEAVAAGEAEVHSWLIALAKLGTVTDRDTALDLTGEQILERLTARLGSARHVIEGALTGAHGTTPIAEAATRLLGAVLLALLKR